MAQASCSPLANAPLPRKVSGQDPCAPQHAVVDPDEAVTLWPESVRLVQPTDDFDHGFRQDCAPSHFGDLSDRAQRLTELEQLVHALQYVERFELAGPANLSRLKFAHQALPPLLGAPVALVEAGATTPDDAMHELLNRLTRPELVSR
jgi:hypothetical protein